MTRQMQYIITLVLKSSRTITSLATYLYRTPSPTVLKGEMTKHHRQKHNRGHLFSRIIKKRISPISVFLRKNFSLKKILFNPTRCSFCHRRSMPATEPVKIGNIYKIISDIISIFCTLYILNILYILYTVYSV